MGHIGRTLAEVDTALQNVRQDGQTQTLLFTLLDTRIAPVLSLRRKEVALSEEIFATTADGGIIQALRVRA